MEELPIKQGREANFIFEPLDIKFDKNFNPILQTPSQVEDYNLAKSILTDIEVMKTSTAFACGIPLNDDDLHSFMSLIIEQEEEFRRDYGIQKIFSNALNDYVGLGGLIRNKDNVVEVGTLLKAKYLKNGIGTLVTTKIDEHFEEIGNILIAGIWEENTPSIKLVKKTI